METTARQKMSFRLAGNSAGPCPGASRANLTFESRLRPGSRSNVKFKSPTKFNKLLVVLMIQTFAWAGAARGGKCLNRTASLRIAVRRLALSLLPLLLALSVPGIAAAQQAQYELGPEDKLRLRVYEWRAPLDEVFEWTALNGDFIVGGSGHVSLPLIGRLRAAGHTTTQFAESVGQRLMERMKLGDRPEVAVEVIEYRPFYIVGSVAKPGAYPYRPGLTVLQALSIAGGLPRPENDNLTRLGREVISGRGNVRQLGLRIRELMARRARLKAELQRADEITFPEALQSRQADPATEAILEQERVIFSARRTALRTQIATLERLKTYLVEEVKSLREQVKLKNDELSTVQGELSNVTKLVKKGLSVASRQFGLERLAAQLSSDRLRLETALLKAQQEISRTDVAIDEARNKNSIEVATQLREAEAGLEETRDKYETQRDLLYESQFTAPQLLASRRRGAQETEPRYSIVRAAGDGKREEIEAAEVTAVRPGDTIKVRLQMPDDVAAVLDVPTQATR